MFIPIAEILLVFGLLRQYFLASGKQVVPPEHIYLCHLQIHLDWKSISSNFEAEN